MEDEIEDLVELDRCRERAEVLLKEGFAGLTSAEYAALRNGWTDPGDPIEQGLLVRCLATWKLQDGPLKKSRSGDGTFSACLRELRVIDLDDPPSGRASGPSGDPMRDKIPVFRAATALRALAATGTHALSNAALRCLIRIVEEIHTANSPNWAMGGARGGGIGQETAFMTLRCVQAILDLADVLDRTKAFLQAEWKPATARTLVPNLWTEIDEERRKLSLEISRASQIPNLALGVENRTRNASTHVADVIAKAQRFLAGQPRCERPSPQGRRSRRMRLDGRRHERAKSLWTQFLEVFYVPANDVESWLGDTAAALRDLLNPSARYLSNALDHQISETHVRVGSTCDVAELIFAAYGVGILSRRWAGNEWDDPRFATVLQVIKATLTDDGRVPSHSPFDVAGKGYVLTVAGIEVSSSLAQLLMEIDDRPDTATARKILRLFESTKTKDGGWRHERNADGTCDWWLSALAVDALRDLTRMLSKWINRRVLRHLSHRTPNDDLSLDGLFYPDYALSRTKDLDGNPRKSLAITLLRMRAHVIGQKIPELQNLHSAVLYGPPGTGKTTLFEALACSCKVPLVEITPSDLLAGGAEQVERRARALFTALSLLSDVVILFDEFDSILRRRQSNDATPATIFAFLTPGMLPKLKNLHSRAKDRRVAYALATNLVGTLDEAAIREGRFDEHLGVFPPDLLSRTGRLISQLERIDGAQKCWEQTRILEVVNETSGGPMSRLGNKGWFSAAKWESLEDIQGGTVFDYILKKGGKPPFPPREKKFKNVIIGEGARAREETAAWAFVELFDGHDFTRNFADGERPARIKSRRALSVRLSDSEVSRVADEANRQSKDAKIEGDDAAQRSELEDRFLRGFVKKLDLEGGAS